MDKDNRPGWAFAELTNAVIAHHAGAIDQAIQRAIEAGVSPDQIRLKEHLNGVQASVRKWRARRHRAD
ncbi:hypothetical protein [Pannonibacter tanglangensis]|uniref:DUF305 domain-containing protein n=1 Tax=Pannonibacter tanglangensis TaxID=2750084 RepID=A0ABW9ZFW6_9HYPH|nr:hypothetical protein [Pannonibacter sp. XCT-34]NBN62069.1 hypothetical protein [Pannonibacter sp. XCT-34]